MLGIALGVTALITVLSVMNGFEQELRARILGMTAHATISGWQRPLTDWPTVVREVEQQPQVIAAAPYIQREGMVIHGQQVHGTLLRGVLPDQEPRVSEVATKMVAGTLDTLQAGSYRIILGRDLARSLGVDVGDRITLVSPTANVSLVGVMPRSRRFQVSGIFEIGMYEYDSALALVHLDDAATLYRIEGVSGVRLKLHDLFQAPAVSRQLAQQLPGYYQVRDWTQYHTNFFRAIQTEKSVMFVILLLIVAVAAFNIVSTLVMVVTDKQSDIAILRTLGASPRGVMAIFMVQGTLIGIIGTLLGLAGGITLALHVEQLVPALERLFGVEFLPADVYYISRLPSELHWDQVAQIGIIALVISMLATLYPAWRAARTQPAEALRYE